MLPLARVVLAGEEVTVLQLVTGLEPLGKVALLGGRLGTEYRGEGIAQAHDGGDLGRLELLSGVGGLGACRVHVEGVADLGRRGDSLLGQTGAEVVADA